MHHILDALPDAMPDLSISPDPTTKAVTRSQQGMTLRACLLTFHLALARLLGQMDMLQAWLMGL